MFKFTKLDVKPAVGGETGMDIKLSTAARKKFPYAVECKNVEKLNMWAAIEQSERNAENLIPIVVFKKNRTKTYCVVEFKYFLELVERAS